MNRAGKIIFILFLLFVVSAGAAVYFYMQYQDTQEAISKTEEQQNAELVKAVSQHVVLPANEEPAIATVSNAEEVRGQEFFRNAQNGYKVLVFQGSGFAVLYDPERDKIVNLAQLDVGSVSGVQTTQIEDQDSATSSIDEIAPELEPVSSDSESVDETTE